MTNNEFETIDETWNALVLAREESARLRKRLGEHDGCSRWGLQDSIALKPITSEPSSSDVCTCGDHIEEHACPYREEIFGDSETVCQCCPVCVKHCCDET